MANNRNRAGGGGASAGGQANRPGRPGAAAVPTQSQRVQEWLISKGVSPERAARLLRKNPTWDRDAARTWWQETGRSQTQGGQGTEAQVEDSESDDSGGDAGGSAATPTAVDTAEENRRKSAKAVLDEFLSTHNITELGDDINNWLAEGWDVNAIMTFVRASDAYHNRFPAMRARREAGLPPISEEAYLLFEDTAAQLEQYYGLTKGLLDKATQTKLLTANVSPRELEERVAINQEAATRAPKEVQDALQRLYGASVGDLTSYYLDPDRAVSLIQAQYAASKAAGGAAAAKYRGTVDTQMAERMARDEIGYAEARERFGRVNVLSGLTAGYGETTSEGALIESQVFGTAEDAANVERVQRSRQARFMGGGGAASSESGISGLGTSER